MNFKKQIFSAACALMISSLAFAADMKESAKDASEQVKDSIKIIQKLDSEESMKPILRQAKGIFVVPSYARAALGVGGRGGEGIVLLKQASGWSDPVFYNFGGLNVGAQVGVEGGPMAFILNNDKAVQEFKQKNNFSMNTDAGLTIVDWSAKAQGDLSKADVIAWSDTKGLFGGAAIGLEDIRFDEKDTKAFYGKTVGFSDIYSGKSKAPQPKVAELKKVLPMDKPALSGGSTAEDRKDDKK